jgi:hypothetical protein
MPRIQPTPLYLIDTKRKWEQAQSRQEQKRIIDEAREPFGYSYAHMTKLLKLGVRKRSHSPKEKVRTAELEFYARKVYEFKIKADYDQKTFTIRKAYEALVEDKQIPEDVSLKSIRETARRICLSNEHRSPARKFRGRSAPLHLVQLDYSKSEYFRFRKSGSIFMEKPVDSKKHESRLYIGAAVDWASRVCWFGYFMTEGESSKFVRDVMLKVFEEKSETNERTGEVTYTPLLQGIPREIYFDRGSGNMSGETAAGMKKLGIVKISGSVEIDSMGRRTNRSNKKGRGMIEKFIGDFKRGFEATLWGRKLLGSFAPDITLRELNELALEYCKTINQNPHPVTGEIRWKVFTSAFESIKFPSADAKMFFDGTLPRKVQSRLIMGRNRNDWFIAPQFVNDGDTVDIILSGSDGYLFYETEMVKLKPQAGSIREMIAEETGSESYSDFTLRERFATELETTSGGRITLRLLPDHFEEELEEFFSKPRNSTDIKSKVQYFIGLTENRPLAKVIPFTGGRGMRPPA